MSDRADRTADPAERTSTPSGKTPSGKTSELPVGATSPSEGLSDDQQTLSLPGLPKIISFASLARCGDEVWIETGGQVYRLRKTRQGKLILTK